MSRKKVFSEKYFLKKLENVGALKDTKAKNVSQRSLVKVRNISIGLVLAAFALDEFSDQEVLKWIRKGRKLTNILSDQFMLYKNLSKYIMNDTKLKDIEEWKAVLDSPYVWPTKDGEDEWCKLFGHVPDHCKDILGILRTNVDSRDQPESPEQKKRVEKVDVSCSEDGDSIEVPITSKIKMEAKSEFSKKESLKLVDKEDMKILEVIPEKEDSNILKPEPNSATSKSETVENIQNKIESPQRIVKEIILINENEDPEKLSKIDPESILINKRLHEETVSKLIESEEPMRKRVKQLREMKVRGNKYTMARQKQLFNYKKKLKYAVRILNGYSKCRAKIRHIKESHKRYDHSSKDKKSANSNSFMEIIQNKQVSKKRKTEFQSHRKGNKRICEKNIVATKKINSQVLFLEMDKNCENSESDEDEKFEKISKIIIDLPNYTSIKSEKITEIVSNNVEDCQDFWAPLISDSDDNDFNDAEGDSDIAYDNNHDNSNMSDNTQDGDNVKNTKNYNDKSNNNNGDHDNCHQKIEKFKEECIEKDKYIRIKKNNQGRDFCEDDNSQNTIYKNNQELCNNAEVKITSKYCNMKENEIVEERICIQHTKENENKGKDNLPYEKNNKHLISTIEDEQRISEIKGIDNITEMGSLNDTASLPEINNTYILKLDNNLQHQKGDLKKETRNNFSSKEYDLIFMKAENINNVNESINDSGIEILDHKDLPNENELNRNDNYMIDNKQETTIRKETEDKQETIRIETKQEITIIKETENNKISNIRKETENKKETTIINETENKQISTIRKETETADDIINALLSHIQQSKSSLEIEISNENFTKTVSVTSETKIAEESLINAPNESVLQKGTAGVSLLKDEVAEEVYGDNEKNMSLEHMEMEHKSIKLNEKKDEEVDKKSWTKSEVFEAPVAVRSYKSKVTSDNIPKEEKIRLGRCSKKERKPRRSKSEKKRKTLNASEKESAMSNDNCKNKEDSDNQSRRNDVTKFQISSFIENIRCSNEYETDDNTRTVDRNHIKNNNKNEQRKKCSVFKRMGSKESEIDKPVKNIHVKTRAGRRAAAEAGKLIVTAPAADLLAFKGGYRCEICRNNYQDKAIHLANPVHEKNRNHLMRKLIEQEDCLVLQHSSGNIKCLWCNVLLIGPENSKEHLNDPKHREAVKEAASDRDFSLVKKDNGGYWCKICFQILQDKAKHLADPGHKTKAIMKNPAQAELLKKLIKEVDGLQECLSGEIECVWCNLKMSDLGIVKRHLNGVLHRSVCEKMDLNKHTRKAPINNSATESSTKSVNEENHRKEYEKEDDLNNLKITTVAVATLTGEGLTEDKNKQESASAKMVISNENKGFKMLAALGWKEGEGLGKDKEGRLEPIPCEFKNNRTGIGSTDVAPLKKTCTKEHNIVAQNKKIKNKINNDRMEENQFNRIIVDLLKLRTSNKMKFDKVLMEELKACKNPYSFVLQCIERCPSLNKPKPDYQASAFLETLQHFKKKKGDQEMFQTYIDECILDDFLEIIPKIKNYDVQSLFINTFGLPDMDYEKRLVFEPRIREMIAFRQYKDACSLISAFKLHKQFIGEPLIVPLFLSCNDVDAVDKFINGSQDHQKEFLTVLDNLFGIIGYYNVLVKEYGIENKCISQTKSNFYSIIATKLLKKYNMEVSHCPYILNKRLSGSLRFIFKKNYEEKSIQPSTFNSLVHDIVKDSPQIQKLMMEYFCQFQDINAALPYVNKYQIPVATLPKRIKNEYSKFSPKERKNLEFLANNGMKEVIETWDESLPEYYQLKLSKDDVDIVDTIEKFVSCIDKARKASVMALDAEWKPSFGFSGGEEDIVLLQLAFDKQAFLIDFMILSPILDETHWIMLINIFKNEKIRKLGFGFDNNLKILKTMNPTMVKNFVNLKNILDLNDFKNHLMLNCPKIFKFENMKNTCLSGMVFQCFGQPLNKIEEYSNWSARPLSIGQIKYAAQDAQCLIDIYDYLDESYKSCGLPDWKVKSLIKAKYTQAQKAVHIMATRLGKIPVMNRLSIAVQSSEVARMKNPPVTKINKKMVNSKHYVPASKSRAACDSGVQKSQESSFEDTRRNMKYEKCDTKNADRSGKKRNNREDKRISPAMQEKNSVFKRLGQQDLEIIPPMNKSHEIRKKTVNSENLNKRTKYFDYDRDESLNFSAHIRKLAATSEVPNKCIKQGESEIPIQKLDLYCTVCRKPLFNEPIKDHIQSKNHHINVISWLNHVEEFKDLDIEEKEKDEISQLAKFNMSIDLLELGSKDKETYQCLVCNLLINNMSSLNEHVCTEKHIMITKVLLMIKEEMWSTQIFIKNHKKVQMSESHQSEFAEKIIIPKSFNKYYFISKLCDSGALKCNILSNKTQVKLKNIPNITVGLVVASKSLKFFNDNNIIQWISPGTSLSYLVQEQMDLYDRLVMYLNTNILREKFEKWELLLDKRKYIWPKEVEGWAKIFGDVPDLCKNLTVKGEQLIVEESVNESQSNENQNEDILEIIDIENKREEDLNEIDINKAKINDPSIKDFKSNKKENEKVLKITDIENKKEEETDIIIFDKAKINDPSMKDFKSIMKENEKILEITNIENKKDEEMDIIIFDKAKIDYPNMKDFKSSKTENEEVLEITDIGNKKVEDADEIIIVKEIINDACMKKFRIRDGTETKQAIECKNSIKQTDISMLEINYDTLHTIHSDSPIEIIIDTENLEKAKSIEKSGKGPKNEVKFRYKLGNDNDITQCMPPQANNNVTKEVTCDGEFPMDISIDTKKQENQVKIIEKPSEGPKNDAKFRYRLGKDNDITKCNPPQAISIFTKEVTCDGESQIELSFDNEKLKNQAKSIDKSREDPKNEGKFRYKFGSDNDITKCNPPQAINIVTNEVTCDKSRILISSNSNTPLQINRKRIKESIQALKNEISGNDSQNIKSPNDIKENEGKNSNFLIQNKRIKKSIQALKKEISTNNSQNIESPSDIEGNGTLSLDFQIQNNRIKESIQALKNEVKENNTPKIETPNSNKANEIYICENCTDEGHTESIDKMIDCEASEEFHRKSFTKNPFKQIIILGKDVDSQQLNNLKKIPNLTFREISIDYHKKEEYLQIIRNTIKDTSNTLWILLPNILNLFVNSSYCLTNFTSLNCKNPIYMKKFIRSLTRENYKEVIKFNFKILQYLGENSAFVMVPSIPQRILDCRNTLIVHEILHNCKSPPSISSDDVSTNHFMNTFNMFESIWIRAAEDIIKKQGLHSTVLSIYISAKNPAIEILNKPSAEMFQGPGNKFQLWQRFMASFIREMKTEKIFLEKSLISKKLDAEVSQSGLVEVNKDTVKIVQNVKLVNGRILQNVKLVNAEDKKISEKKMIDHVKVIESNAKKLKVTVVKEKKLEKVIEAKAKKLVEVNATNTEKPNKKNEIEASRHFVKKFSAEDCAASKNKSKENLVFCDGIDKHWTDERSIFNYFYSFGEITNIVVPPPDQLHYFCLGHINRGYAFVYFKSENPLEEILSYVSHMIDGKVINIRTSLGKKVPDKFNDLSLVAFVVPTELSGELIGKGDTTINEIQKKSGAFVEKSQSTKSFVISGKKGEVECAKRLINKALGEIKPYYFEMEDCDKETIDGKIIEIRTLFYLPSGLCKLLLGKGGFVIGKIHFQSGALFRQDENGEVFTLLGKSWQIDCAKKLVAQALKGRNLQFFRNRNPPKLLVKKMLEMQDLLTPSITSAIFRVPSHLCEYILRKNGFDFDGIKQDSGATCWMSTRKSDNNSKDETFIIKGTKKQISCATKLLNKVIDKSILELQSENTFDASNYSVMLIDGGDDEAFILDIEVQKLLEWTGLVQVSGREFFCLACLTKLSFWSLKEIQIHALSHEHKISVIFAQSRKRIRNKLESIRDFVTMRLINIMVPDSSYTPMEARIFNCQQSWYSLSCTSQPSMSASSYVTGGGYYVEHSQHVQESYVGLSQCYGGIDAVSYYYSEYPDVLYSAQFYRRPALSIQRGLLTSYNCSVSYGYTGNSSSMHYDNLYNKSNLPGPSHCKIDYEHQRPLANDCAAETIVTSSAERLSSHTTQADISNNSTAGNNDTSPDITNNSSSGNNVTSSVEKLSSCSTQPEISNNATVGSDVISSVEKDSSSSTRSIISNSDAILIVNACVSLKGICNELGVIGLALQALLTKIVTDTKEVTEMFKELDFKLTMNCAKVKIKHLMTSTTDENWRVKLLKSLDHVMYLTEFSEE